eukprot:gene327-biopygen9000
MTRSQIGRLQPSRRQEAPSSDRHAFCSTVQRILNNAVVVLYQNPNRTFVFSEVVFFRQWWGQMGPQIISGVDDVVVLSASAQDVPKNLTFGEAFLVLLKNGQYVGARFLGASWQH